MFKKLLLSVSLLAGVLLKADVEPKITIQRGDAQVTLTKKEYMNYLYTTFKFLNTNEKESKLLKFLNKKDDNSMNYLFIATGILSSAAYLLSPEILRLLDVNYTYRPTYFSTVGLLHLIDVERDSLPVYSLVASVIIQASFVKKLLEGRNNVVKRKIFGFFIGAESIATIGAIAKAVDVLLLTRYRNSWNSFAQNNSVNLSDDELTLYHSCYSKNINENLVLRQIQAYVDKISLS